jgi:hypothetical protein
MAPKKSNEEIFRDLDRLIEHYGIDLSGPEKLAWKVLLYALRDGRVRLPPKRRPPRKRGPHPKWTGEEGLELVEAVEAVQRDELGQGRSISIENAIKELQPQCPAKWGGYDPDVLRRRYYEAKLFWNYARRLLAPYFGSAENSWPN